VKKCNCEIFNLRSAEMTVTCGRGFGSTLCCAPDGTDALADQDKWCQQNEQKQFCLWKGFEVSPTDPKYSVCSSGVNGDPCYENGDCKPAADERLHECQLGDNKNLPGKCVITKKVPNGSNCEEDGDCLVDWNAQNGYCDKDRTHTCIIWTKYDVGADCKSDLDCKTNRCLSGKCQNYIQNGDLCDRNSDCQSKNCVPDSGCIPVDTTCDSHCRA
jgi:hypothetical protein